MNPDGKPGPGQSSQRRGHEGQSDSTSLLQRVRRRRGGTGTILVSQRFGYLYVTNQKAACSTIKLLLARAEMDDPAFTPDGPIHSEVGKTSLAGHKEPERLEAMLRGEAFRFTFVRNPYARFLSAYCDKVAELAHGDPNHQGDGRRPLYLQELAKSVGLSAADIGNPTFAEFVGLVERQPPSVMNRHWRPQVLNTCHRLIEYEFVGKVESFDADMRFVAGRCGFPLHMPAQPLNHTGTGQLIAEYYTADLRARVHAIYREDFEAFGYSPELSATPATPSPKRTARRKRFELGL
jgi:hypothetical protein